MPQAVVAENGTLIGLAPDGAEVLGHLPSGRLVLDGTRLLPMESPVLRGRQRLLYAGIALLSLVADAEGELVADPELTMQGVVDPEEEEGAVAGALDAVEEAFAALPRGARQSDERLRETARLAVRRSLFRTVGKKPVTKVHLQRL